jgi:hypothetical protein
MTRTDISMDEAMVRAKAFELWQARGCPMGSPEQDWFSAKQSISGADSSSSPPRARAQSEELPLGLCIVEEPSSGNSKPPLSRGTRADAAKGTSPSSLGRTPSRKTSPKRKSR